MTRPKSANGSDDDLPLQSESFLERWSRRKSEAHTGSETGLTDENSEQSETESKEAVSDDKAPHDHDEDVAHSDCSDGEKTKVDFSKIDFDALDYNSDYTQFMGPDVPDDIRNKALRKLWVSNPILANIDGLDDYCEDYTDAAMVPDGPVKTAYRVGKGFLSDEEVAEWEKLGQPKSTEEEEKVFAEHTSDDVAEGEDDPQTEQQETDAGDLRVAESKTNADPSESEHGDGIGVAAAASVKLDDANMHEENDEDTADANDRMKSSS